MAGTRLGAHLVQDGGKRRLRGGVLQQSQQVALQADHPPLCIRHNRCRPARLHPPPRMASQHRGGKYG